MSGPRPAGWAPSPAHPSPAHTTALDALVVLRVLGAIGPERAVTSATVAERMAFRGPVVRACASVRRAVQALVRFGVARTERRRRPDGRVETVYWLRPPDGGGEAA